jgi:hypothetical protein
MTMVRTPGYGSRPAPILRACWPSTPEADMIETTIFRLKHDELTCSAHASDNGRFEPALVISNHIWPSRPRTIAMRRGAHPTAEVPIESAQSKGLEKVRDFG